jgi:hypothetical protein
LASTFGHMGVSAAKDTVGAVATPSESTMQQGSLRGPFLDRNLRVADCPTTAVPGEACSSPSQTCGYEHIFIPALKKNTRCDFKAAMTCTPTMTCICSDDSWECEDAGEVEKCGGRVPAGAYEPCRP